MKQFFMDTSGWIALNSKRDQLYSKAVELNKKLLKSGYAYVTTNFVLDETYTGLMTKVGHYVSVDFGEKIRLSKLVSVIHISREIEDRAWKVFTRYSDKDFSFTDCTSFIVMKQLRLTDVFTNDRHFEQIGFAFLLK
jgi:predicted nucleic acid-binding protein